MCLLRCRHVTCKPLLLLQPVTGVSAAVQACHLQAATAAAAAAVAATAAAATAAAAAAAGPLSTGVKSDWPVKQSHPCIPVCLVACFVIQLAPCLAL